ncbi:coiled-coil domain-containing protein 174-like isoform X1 [Varroa destructor]|uniref:CCDC174 alpha/beta GRSR domain-containing protein n=1 Tax=Varroa destructor TaxID=109461 RepID=A0A7M7JYY2_VARDE|nr:coiled-coil domain-containing protein 174-like isoform X1 [Varroa destructor]XP_022654848.1 coiled-coil domain-containing protein 174-like isoform X1 [Varroa destructor]XP_022654849.1 coiled-coil domain-containing protein 174-like isoform X1 [Varroa destructor]XP_022654850.1 coiled-coil domain-containing protein 174-like isoform X1 [Varroa destructor]
MSLGSGSSAIIDLKAELLRKRNQAEAKSRQNAEKISENTVRKGGFRVEQRVPKEKKSKTKITDPPPLEDDIDSEEENALRESRRRLEEKAHRYEAMKSSAIVDPWSLYAGEQNDDATLVDFGAKVRLNILEASNQHQLEKGRKEAVRDSDDADSSGDDDDEWTTFTDSLGRTRKCLKTELTIFLREDERLRKSLEKSHSNEAIGSIPLPVPTGEGVDSEAGIKISKPMNAVEDLEKEKRLRQWAQVEQENAAKERIHYRDVLFNEVREHGQVHFEFSRNEAERSEQLKILDGLREESIQNQKAAQEVKKRKQAILQQRLNRIRERKGLPPGDLDEPDIITGAKAEIIGAKDERRQPSLAATSTASPAPVRPWDEGKELHGVPISKCRGLSTGRKRNRFGYEDYIESCRQERIPEFAPPMIYSEARQQTQANGPVRISGSSSGIAEIHKQQREPTKVDLDEFLKVMRNLS